MSRTSSRSPILTLSVVLLFSCLALPLAFAVDGAAADETWALTEMVPHDALVYVSVSGLDTLAQLVVELPEWHELKTTDRVADGLVMPEQLMTMLLGLTWNEFIGLFGHRMAVNATTTDEGQPRGFLVLDARDNREVAEYAIGQFAAFAGISGEMELYEQSHREVPYTAIVVGNLALAYGFVGDFLVVGLNGGFAQAVDLQMDGGKTIADDPEFQAMRARIDAPGELLAYANVKRLVSAVPQLQIALTGDTAPGSGPAEEADAGARHVRAFVGATNSVAVSLNLAGTLHTAYVDVDPDADNPLMDLLTAPRTPMSSAQLWPVEGALIGLHLGDPAVLIDTVLDLAEASGHDRAQAKGAIAAVEEHLGMSVRDDLLSALTGEVAVVGRLPQEPVNFEENKLDVAKLRASVLLGVRDRAKLERVASQIAQSIPLDAREMEATAYEGTDIYKMLLPLDTVVPGVALMPTYAFRDDLLVISNREQCVRDAIDALVEGEVGGAGTDAGQGLASSCVLLFADSGRILDFLNDQGLTDEMDLPEEVADDLEEIGSVTVSASANSDGVGLRILSENPWVEEVLRVVRWAILADQSNGEANADDDGE